MTLFQEVGTAGALYMMHCTTSTVTIGTCIFGFLKKMRSTGMLFINFQVIKGKGLL